jgi:hypothetical protein
MTNSKTALFLRETRCFDDEISHQTRESRALEREKYLCARMRRRISVRDVAYQSSHQNTLLIIRAKIIFFAVLALKTRRLGLY